MKNNIQRRLLPLYIAAFSQGLVFWYVIDKLLATSVGLNATSIALVIGLQSIMTVALEIPSGILADRWSRRGVLVISQLFLLGATITGIFASSGWHYLMIALFWGAFYAMYSGTYEAIVYDLLVEEQGHARDFESRYGRIGQFDGVSLMVGSLVGGLVASRYTLHAPFLLTLPGIVVGLVAMFWFNEPTTHLKVSEESKLLTHIKETFAAVMHSPILVSLFFVSAALGSILRLGWEFSQLWYINLHLPVALFGVFNSSLFLALVLRAWLVRNIKVERFKLLLMLLCAAVFATGLLMVKNPYIGSAGVTMLMLLTLSAMLVLTGLQQTRLPSNVRAGATSVLSTFAHIIFVPIGLIFGVLVDKFGISKASWFVTILLLCAVLFAWRALALKRVGSSSAPVA